jgi:hypothetical protein
LPTYARLVASNPFCAKSIDNKKCPDFIKNYKDCDNMSNPKTFVGAEKPGMDDTNIKMKCWNGKWFERTFKYESTNGFVEEFYDGEHCYMGSLNVPGTSLMGNNTLGVFYMIFLFWLFLGISVIADIFMEAIEVITSTTKDV